MSDPEDASRTSGGNAGDITLSPTPIGSLFAG
jgi:hypothetical protein